MTELPDDASLEELALYIIASETGQRLAALPKNGVIIVAFYRKDRGNEREQMPYTETLGVFRALANTNKAWMEISDGRGGTRVGKPELVS